MSKVTVVGAGNVGATCANVLAHKDLVKEVVLVDIKGDLARGKALDSWQQAPIDHYSTYLMGTEDYAHTADSDIVVITAGVPRKPGMSRDDLISTNAKIVNSVVDAVMQHSRNPVIIVVSNPLDVMTYAAYKASRLPDQRVFGMAGILDTARYRAFLATELSVSPKDIQAVLMGGHGDTMVPLPRFSTVAGIPITELMPADRIEALVDRTRNGGAEIVSLLKTGSAFYAPASSAVEMAKAILMDKKMILPCAALLEGEYGFNDLFIGVPVKLGKNGVEEVIQIQLTDDEAAALKKSADSVEELKRVLAKLS